MLGYSHKHHAVSALLQKYEKNVDGANAIAVDGRGGHNKKLYRLTLECANRFAINANTPEGCEVANFFVQINAVTQEFVLIDSAIRGHQRERLKVEDKLLKVFGGADVIYVGFVQHLDESSDVYSIGHTSDIESRAKAHRKGS